jgi:hypothetical protein
VYYVLFETGNEDFFFEVIKNFCSTYVNNIVEVYKDYKQKGSILLDSEGVDKFMRKNGRGLDVFNCAQHLLITDCPNHLCKERHTTVLSKKQGTKFEEIMRDEKNKYYRLNYTENEKMIKQQIQNVFSSHARFSSNSFKLEKLDFERTDDPDNFFDMYVKQVDNYVEKDRPHRSSSTKNCAYVRAATGSDYVKFINSTKLQNVVPCDEFQNLLTGSTAQGGFTVL